MTNTRLGKIKATRELAYQILFDFERTHSRLDILELKYLKGNPLSAQDRRFLKQIFSGSIRYLEYLDWIISKLYHGRFFKLLDKTKTILRLAIYEIIYLSSVPEHATVSEYVSLAKKKINHKQGSLVNAILRNYLKLKSKPDPIKEITDKAKLLSIKYSFPLWMVNRWIELWGSEKTERLCEAFNREPDFDIHINPEKIETAQVEKLLHEKNISFQKSDLFEGVYKIKNVQQLIHLGWLDYGVCSVQDESAHIPVELLNVQDDDVVLDMCAAPGSKFIQILQKKKKLSVAMAVDVDKNRLKRIKENLQRLKLDNGILVIADGKHLPFKPVFSRILLDAPCSGLGVIRKHPDIKWRRSEAEIISFAKLQTELLEQAAEHLKIGGKMVYSTCTVDPRENEEITTKFLDKRKDQFKQLNPPKAFEYLSNERQIHTFPDENQMDGSYCTVIKKI